ncbi:MAG: DUF4870 domain-containing protein [Candidatus Eremiobacteraeota bacterium]|nr:DUF4870 domain-containing protein [Candidatus Eremiobacteraeota bacterium]
MSVTQPPSDAPFGLQPNVAAGLAYLFTWLGGIIFLVGGGTNKFVKFAAAQSLTFWILFWIVQWVLMFLAPLTHGLTGFVLFIWWIVGFVVWIWTMISGFQGKDLRLPVVAGITESIFKSAVA